MHVPTVVASNVVAQRMEGEVAVGQVSRGLPFQVTLESRAERFKPDDLRVHEQLDRRLLDGIPAQQPERVGPYRGRRPDGDDRAAVGRDHEQLVVAGPGGQRGNGEGRAVQADRDFDVQRAQPRPGTVGGDESARRGRADADPGRVKLDGGAEARPRGDEAHRDEQRDQAAGRDEEQLLPAEPAPEHPGRHHDDDGGAARGCRHLPYPPRDGTRRSQRGGEAGCQPICFPCLAEIPDDPERTRALRHRHAPRLVGGRTWDSSLPMTSSTLTPENSASASSSSRWLITGMASSLTSSGTT